MSGWLKEALKLFGFSTPFIYASVVYSIFRYLDKKASGPAKKAVSSWLQSSPVGLDTIGNAVIEMFNRIYTPVLVSPGAFTRSASITLCMSAIFLYEAYLPGSIVYRAALRNYGANSFLIGTVLGNVLSDYVSLFVVKATLVAGRNRPMASLGIGVAKGMLVVVAFAVAQNLAVAIYDEFERGVGFSSMFSSSFFWDNVRSNIEATTERPWAALFLASLVVHLWLPLFLLAAWSLRSLEYLKLAIGWAQWFIKQGQHHPFEAVGYVAALIVFVIGAILQYFI